MASAGSAHLTPAVRWRRLAAAVGVAGATGVASAFVRPMIAGPIHYEALVSIFIVLPTVCLVLTLSLRDVPWGAALGPLVLELAAVCVAFPAGVWLGPGGFADDLLGVMAGFWLIAVLACAGLLVGRQYFRPPVLGPYCPGCGYCLIGAPTDRCPECGRDFDPSELGVTREALRPPPIGG